MADLEDRYQQAFDDANPLSVATGRWQKVGVTLIGGSCLVLVSFLARSISSTTVDSVAESTSLLGVSSSKSGLAWQSRRNVNNMNNKAKMPEYGSGWFSRNSPSRPISMPTQAKVEDASEVKPSWDFGRFAKTAGEFGYLKPPNPLKVISQIMGSGTAAPGKAVPRNEVLWSPAINPFGLVFRPLDDVVMGGSSASSFDDATGVWSGEVITIGGGFVGIRTLPFEPPLDFSLCSGIRLKVKGNGQRFKCIIRDDEEFNGIAWSFSFDTNPFFDTEVKIPFKDFVPTKFAKVVKPEPTLNAATISALQVTYSKFEYESDLNPKFNAGEFNLVIKEIDTY